MTPVRIAEANLSHLVSPILLELKEREHQLDPVARQALENVLIERRLVDTGNPAGPERRNAGPVKRDKFW